MNNNLNQDNMHLIAKDLEAGRLATMSCHLLMASDPTNPVLPFNMALATMGVSWFNLGHVLKPGILDEAEKYAKKAVELSPKSIECQSLLAAILINSWKWTEAANVLDYIFGELLLPTFSWQRVTPNEHAQIKRNAIKLWGLFALRESRGKTHEKKIDQSLIDSFTGVNAKSGWKRNWSLFSSPIEMTQSMVDNLRFFEAFSGARRFHDIHKISGPITNGFEECYRAFMTDLPMHIKDKVAPPRIFGEIGWEVDGQIVNANTLKDIDHVVQFSQLGILDNLLSRRERRPLRILEIGPGYGGLSYLIHAVLQPESLVLVDLLDSLGFSSTYLTLACNLNDSTLNFHDGIDPALLSKHQGLSLVPEFLADDLYGQGTFDLIVNTGSLGEMSASEVLGYIKIINDVLAPDGFVYDVNNHIPELVQNNFQGEILNIAAHERIWVKDKKQVTELLKNISSFGGKFQPWGRSARYHSQMSSEWFKFMD